MKALVTSFFLEKAVVFAVIASTVVQALEHEPEVRHRERND